MKQPLIMTATIPASAALLVFGRPRQPAKNPPSCALPSLLPAIEAVRLPGQFGPRAEIPTGPRSPTAACRKNRRLGSTLPLGRPRIASRALDSEKALTLAKKAFERGCGAATRHLYIDEFNSEHHLVDLLLNVPQSARTSSRTARLSPATRRVLLARQTPKQPNSRPQKHCHRLAVRSITSTRDIRTPDQLIPRPSLPMTRHNRVFL